MVDEIDLDSLSEEELAAYATVALCGLSLAEMLDEASPEDDRRELVGSFAMTKVGTAAEEALCSDALAGPEDVAELALILVEAILAAAKQGSAHRHKLASGLRALARDT